MLLAVRAAALYHAVHAVVKSYVAYDLEFYGVVCVAQPPDMCAGPAERSLDTPRDRQQSCCHQVGTLPHDGHSWPI